MLFIYFLYNSELFFFSPLEILSEEKLHWCSSLFYFYVFHFTTFKCILSFDDPPLPGNGLSKP